MSACQLLLGLLRVFHPLVDKVGTAVDTAQYHRPGKLPQSKEEDAKGDEHPEDEAEIGRE